MSDRSLQNDVEPIDNAGTTLDQINGIWYSPTEMEESTKEPPTRYAGVSAQEVEKVLPEAVTADENGKLLVNYETLTVFLIEAIKEQRQEIQELRNILEKRGLLE